MTQETEDHGRPTPKPNDRKAKLIFLAVALVAAGLIWWFLQTKEKTLPGWPDDLNAARARAKEADRRVLAVFLSDPLNKDCGIPGQLHSPQRSEPPGNQGRQVLEGQGDRGRPQGQDG